MYCRYCGENNPDEAVFCKNCGKIAIVPYAIAKIMVRIIVPKVKFQFLNIFKSRSGFLVFNSHQISAINATKLVIPSLQM